MSQSQKTFGLLAEYETPGDIMRAAEKVREAGYRYWDVYTPFPIHGMDDAMGLKDSKVGWFSFFGGVAGFSLGMGMIWWMGAVNYKIPVGGKPLFSALFAFPVSYELTILLASFATLFGMLYLNGLPKLHNPLHRNQRFKLATHDRYFVVIECNDPRFSETETRKLLESTGCKHIEMVEA